MLAYCVAICSFVRADLLEGVNVCGFGFFPFLGGLSREPFFLIVDFFTIGFVCRPEEEERARTGWVVSPSPRHSSGSARPSAPYPAYFVAVNAREFNTREYELMHVNMSAHSFAQTCMKK